MDNIEPMAILAILYVVIGVVGRIAKSIKKGQGDPRARRPPERVARQSRPAPTTFDELLAEMRSQMETAKTAERIEAAPAERWHDDEDVEDRRSLEEEPVVVSLEVAPPDRQRVRVDHDSGAEQLVADRIAVAEMRNREWQLSDHRRFDDDIRRVAVVRPAAVRAGISLRQAMIWREILSPPVGLRGPAPRDGAPAA